ncbi:hypothetical protein [Crocosphaera sp. Alani8]|uniref:hypothetical protein n=1 Tax=Crocosphaera sp. Alani8 TaxID=3038952 RepID=UPI00313DBCAB
MIALKFSDIEKQMTLVLNTSFSTDELEQLDSEKTDYLKGIVFTHLTKIGKIDKTLVRNFYQDVIAEKKVV